MSSIFTATVLSSDTASFNVQVAPVATPTQSHSQISKIQAVPLSTAISGLLGFKECVLPRVGSLVLCFGVSTTLCYIIGTIPDVDVGNQFASRTILKAGDGNNDEQNVINYATSSLNNILYNVNRPTDLVEGEYVLANEFGVLMGLFQGLATLKGSDLAQIQCFLFDDLVRVISHNFEHLTSMGRLKISHDGSALNAEYTLTHQPKEALGSAEVVSSDYASQFENVHTHTVDDKQDFFELKNGDFTEAISRLKVFVGKLGDFVKIVLSSPQPGQVNKMDGSTPATETGLADFFLGTDGKIHVRSIAEIFIEKTNWIKVPQRIREVEDPSGDFSVTYDNKPLFDWDNAASVNGNPFLYFLQLRDYALYTQEKLGYGNFRKHTKDFFIGEDAPPNLDEIGQIDPNTPANYRYALRRSGVYLMANGGIMFKDAFGSAIVMEGGNIYQQPAKDLILQPARNLIAKVGQFTSICSQRDIDLSSTLGGYRLNTDLTQYSHSVSGGVILHSESKSNDYSPKDEAVQYSGGVLLKSAGGVYTDSDTFYSNTKNNHTINTDQLVEISNTYVSEIWTSGIVASSGSYNILAKSEAAMISENMVFIAGDGETLVGKKDQIIAFKPANKTSPWNPPMGVAPITSFTNELDKIAGTDFTKGLPDFTDLNFYFLKSSDYNLDDSADFIPQTIYQQDAESSGGNLNTWTEPKVNGTLPYPGSDLFDNFYATAKLQNGYVQNGDLIPNGAEAMTNTSSIQFESLQSYKVK